MITYTCRPITSLVFMRCPVFFYLGVNALARTKRDGKCAALVWIVPKSVYFDGHTLYIAWENRVSEVFCVCLVYHMYMHIDHRKINTRQQTLDYSFETHRNVIRNDGHLPFIRMTQQHDIMQHKSRYRCGKLNMTLCDTRNELGWN